MPAACEVFKKYPNEYFIETGSYLGDGIQAALDAGFLHVFSIELSERYYRLCADRFAGDERVVLVRGDSAQSLWELIRPLDRPITFWLDGHWSGGDTARGAKSTPLMEEIRQIGRHPIREHTILVDDLRCWSEEYDQDIAEGLRVEQVVEAIRSVNPAYRFSYEDGGDAEDVLPNDILVARVDL
jgi:hypothetical protein